MSVSVYTCGEGRGRKIKVGLEIRNRGLASGRARNRIEVCVCVNASMLNKWVNAWFSVCVVVAPATGV